MSEESDDILDRAEQYKRLFVDPAVQAMSDRVEAQLAPIVSGQKKLFAAMGEQKVKDQKQDDRLTELEGKQTRALVGYGIFATGLSVTLAAGWDWLKSKVWGPALLLSIVMLGGCDTSPPQVRVVALDNAELHGSGFIVQSGTIVTAGHVAVSPGLMAILENGDKVATTAPTINTNRDTATLKAPVSGRVQVRKPIIGEPVSIVGYITGEDGRFVKVQARGFVISGPITGAGITQFMVQGAVGPGMSGGPIIAEDGSVVGIVLGTFHPTLIRAGILE